ncbi:hypothetical protein ABPG77_004428 [Micractinium sp. CCAP 211/92]
MGRLCLRDSSAAVFPAPMLLPPTCMLPGRAACWALLPASCCLSWLLEPGSAARPPPFSTLPDFKNAFLSLRRVQRAALCTLSHPCYPAGMSIAASCDLCCVHNCALPDL